jgi:hypothetical protein
MSRVVSSPPSITFPSAVLIVCCLSPPSPALPVLSPPRRAVSHHPAPTPDLFDCFGLLGIDPVRVRASHQRTTDTTAELLVRLVDHPLFEKLVQPGLDLVRRSALTASAFVLHDCFQPAQTKPASTTSPTSANTSTPFTARCQTPRRVCAHSRPSHGCCGQQDVAHDDIDSWSRIPADVPTQLRSVIRSI